MAKRPLDHPLDVLESVARHRNYKNLPVAGDSIIGETFVNLDERTGRGRLGIRFCPTEYDIEARGYAYQRGSKLDHRQVVALAKATA